MSKNPMVGARVSKEIHEQIVQLAAKERRTTSNMIRVLLEDALQRRRQAQEGGTQ